MLPWDGATGAGGTARGATVGVGAPGRDVAVAVAVGGGVSVGVLLGVLVGSGVPVALGVGVAIGVALGVGVAIGVAVGTGVLVGGGGDVCVGADVGVRDGVGVDWEVACPTTPLNISPPTTSAAIARPAAQTQVGKPVRGAAIVRAPGITFVRPRFSTVGLASVTASPLNVAFIASMLWNRSSGRNSIARSIAISTLWLTSGASVRSGCSFTGFTIRIVAVGGA